MHLFVTIKICFFTILAASCIACFSQSDASVNHPIETENYSDPNFQNMVQIEDGKWLKKDGWQIPEPKKMKKLGVTEFDSSLENGGKIKVTTTHYSPVEEFITTEPFTSIGKAQTFALTRIDAIRESIANGKTFRYTIDSRIVKKDERTGEYMSIGSPFFYQYFDKDGDGKFEILITDGSKNSVPSWVLQSHTMP